MNQKSIYETENIIIQKDRIEDVIIATKTEAKEYYVFIVDNFGDFKIDQIKIVADYYEINKFYTIFYLNGEVVGLIRTSSLEAIFDKKQMKLYGRYYNKETK